MRVIVITGRTSLVGGVYLIPEEMPRETAENKIRDTISKLPTDWTYDDLSLALVDYGLIDLDYSELPE